MRRGVALPALLTLAVAMSAGDSTSALAQPIAPQDVPPELRPWVPWVLDTVPDLGCPRVQGNAVCVWPGRLRLDLGDSGGRFTLAVEADRPANLRLPGTPQRWPLEVRLDGVSVPVFEKDDAPRLRLPAGRHVVTGSFAWARLPESLPVPATVGLVQLTLDGLEVPDPAGRAAACCGSAPATTRPPARARASGCRCSATLPTASPSSWRRACSSRSRDALGR